MKIPVLGIILGDAAGIGPEIVCKMLNSINYKNKFIPLIIGDENVFKLGMNITNIKLEYKKYSVIEDLYNLNSSDIIILYDNNMFDPHNKGTMINQAGNSVIEMIKSSVDLINEHIIDAVVYAPINKKLINIANNNFSDELNVFKHFCNYTGFCLEMNYSSNVWTSRVTGHIPLMQVSSFLSTERILDVIKLTNENLKRIGIKNPIIYVSAINPHGGEGGLFGTEENDIILPAVILAKNEGINVEGPLPGDTIFNRAFSGECNAVVTMYHDQGQIALKTKCFNGGITMLAGLPIITVTPAHGVGYDIAGKGIAKYDSIVNAVNLALSMVK